MGKRGVENSGPDSDLLYRGHWSYTKVSDIICNVNDSLEKLGTKLLMWEAWGGLLDVPFLCVSVFISSLYFP